MTEGPREGPREDVLELKDKKFPHMREHGPYKLRYYSHYYQNQSIQSGHWHSAATAFDSWIFEVVSKMSGKFQVCLRLFNFFTSQIYDNSSPPFFVHDFRMPP